MDQIHDQEPDVCRSCGRQLDPNTDSKVPLCADCTPGELTGVRALYRRLAAEYERQPTVPDRRGGVVGDRYPF